MVPSGDRSASAGDESSNLRGSEEQVSTGKNMAFTEGETATGAGATLRPGAGSLVGPAYIFVGGGAKAGTEAGARAGEPGTETGTGRKPGKGTEGLGGARDPGKPIGTSAGTGTGTGTGEGDVAETGTMKEKDPGTSLGTGTGTGTGTGGGTEKGTGKLQESVPEKKKGRGGRRVLHPELSAEERRKLRVLKNRESAMRSLQKKAAYSKELVATEKSVRAEWDKAKGELRGEIEELNRLKSNAEVVRKSTHLEELLHKADELLAKMQAAVESKGEAPALAEGPVSANS